jgi:hypothetical protein
MVDVTNLELRTRGLFGSGKVSSGVGSLQPLGPTSRRASFQAIADKDLARHNCLGFNKNKLSACYKKKIDRDSIT